MFDAGCRGVLRAGNAQLARCDIWSVCLSIFFINSSYILKLIVRTDGTSFCYSFITKNKPIQENVTSEKRSQRKSDQNEPKI